MDRDPSTENVLTHPGGLGAKEVNRAPGPPEPLVSRIDRCVYEKADGTIAQTRTNATGIERRWGRHLAGTSRLGVFLVLPGGVCRAGVVDLDCHGATTPSRHADAVEIVERLEKGGIVAYWAPSRGGRGAHVWMFFEAPGVPADDLRALLDELAAPYQPGVDVRPDRSDYGGPIFLPYFGAVVNMRDIDAKPIPADKLECNNLAVVPRVAVDRRTSAWVPPYKLGGRRSGPASGAFQEALREGEALGLVFFWRGRPQARDGFRNRIAGFIAGSIAGRGGGFEEFVAWDAHNQPPLGETDPGQLERWWRSAQKRHARGRGRGLFGSRSRDASAADAAPRSFPCPEPRRWADSG